MDTAAIYTSIQAAAVIRATFARPYLADEDTAHLAEWSFDGFAEDLRTLELADDDLDGREIDALKTGHKRAYTEALYA